MAKKNPDLTPLMLRLPEVLRKRVAREAARGGRSLNSEIIHRLERSFLQQNFSALMRKHAEYTAKAAAEAAVEKWATLGTLGQPKPEREDKS